MPFADVNGQRIHYSDSGGDGPVVVFSHGFFMDHEMFAPQIEELRPTYRSLSVDARGFGLTESDGRPFTYWDLADGPDRGARLRRCAAGDVRRAVAGRVHDAAGRAAASGPRARHRAARHHRGRRDRGSEGPLPSRRKRRAAHERLDRRVRATGWRPSLFGPDFDASAWIERWKSNPPARIGPAFDALIDRDSVAERLGEITCPALVIRGELDATMSMETDGGDVRRAARLRAGGVDPRRRSHVQPGEPLRRSTRCCAPSSSSTRRRGEPVDGGVRDPALRRGRRRGLGHAQPARGAQRVQRADDHASCSRSGARCATTTTSTARC